jgi:hypothetical protein
MPLEVFNPMILEEFDVVKVEENRPLTREDVRVQCRRMWTNAALSFSFGCVAAAGGVEAYNILKPQFEQKSAQQVIADIRTGEFGLVVGSVVFSVLSGFSFFAARTAINKKNEAEEDVRLAAIRQGKYRASSDDPAFAFGLD